MATEESPSTVDTVPDDSMNLLFVEMGVGYDHDWEYVTAAAMRACRDAMSSNGIPAFHLGSIPGVSADQMKLQIKLGVPRSLHESLDIERIKSFFPYGLRKGEIVKLEVVDGGLICSNGMQREGREDEKNDCYVVNAVIYVGY